MAIVISLNTTEKIVREPSSTALPLPPVRSLRFSVCVFVLMTSHPVFTALQSKFSSASLLFVKVFWPFLAFHLSK